MIAAVDQGGGGTAQPARGTIEPGSSAESDQSTPSNLSAPLRANRIATSAWSWASTLTPNRPVRRMIARRSEPRSRETRIIGGPIDSDVNALTVVPCGRRSSKAVMTATGVQTLAMTSRNPRATWSRTVSFTDPPA